MYLPVIADAEGNIYPTRIIVNVKTSIISDVETIDKLYAINSKKVAGQSPLDFDQDGQPSSTTFKHSIKDLLNDVKDIDTFIEVMPKAFANEQGIYIPDTDISKLIKMSKGLKLESVDRKPDLLEVFTFCFRSIT